MKQEMLEIVNENDEVVSIETRKKVHQDGLLHREIHIWFFTTNKEIIFQHRAKDKDIYPDKLDATVGGHVDPGMYYEDTAVKEAKEETGVDIDINKLIFLTKMKKKTIDETTGLINNTIRAQYAYLYDGEVSDLEVEEGKAIGFEAWKLNKLVSLNKEEKRRFIPAILSEKFLSLFNNAWKLIIESK